MWLSLNLKKKKICPLLLNEYIRQILLLLFIAENQFKNTKMLKYFVNQTFFFFFKITVIVILLMTPVLKVALKVSQCENDISSRKGKKDSRKKELLERVKLGY